MTMWELIVDMETMNFELECAIDNLSAVHTTMEADGAANWQRMCNAVYSACLQMRSLQERMCDLSDQMENELRAQKHKA